jgi:CBS domain containing-hemolysin-like protein
MNTVVLWITGAAALAAAFFLSLLYSSFNACSRSRLESIASERRRLGRLRRLLPALPATTSALFALKHAGELVLAAVIFVGPLVDGAEGTSLTLTLIVQAALAAAAVMVVCEMIPRSVADRRGEEIVLALWPAARAVSVLAAPLVWLRRLIDRLFRRLLSGRSGGSGGGGLTDEVLDAVSESEREGGIRPAERDMIRSIISFRQVDVAEVMTPRTEMVCVQASASPQQAVELMLQHGFSRLPVYETSRDNIVGVLHIKDLIREVRRDPNEPIVEIASAAYFVPETKSIAELLGEFKARKLHFAIVVADRRGRHLRRHRRGDRRRNPRRV